MPKVWRARIGVREGILLGGGAEKICLENSNVPKNKQFALKLTSLLNPNRA